jgi:hypothetical protein
MKSRTAAVASSRSSRRQATERVLEIQRQVSAHRHAPARAYRTVTGKWESPVGGPRSGSA